MIPFLITTGLGLLKEIPELVGLYNDMKANGQTEPTQAQLDALKQALIDRGVEDAIWDSYGK